MRIAVLGKVNQIHWAEHVSDACMGLGHQVLFIGVNQLSFWHDLKRNVYKRLSRRLAENANAIEVSKRLDLFNPDLTIVISPQFLSQELAKRLSNIKGGKVAWVGDRFSPESYKFFEIYDHIYFTDTGFFTIGEFSDQTRFHYLPLGFNDRFFYPRHLTKRSDKIVFIGSSTSNRNAFFKNVSRDVEVKLIGNRWKSRVGSSLGTNFQIVNKFYPLDSVANEYAHSNFILNLRHHENVINGLNMRTFEVMASGCCLFQDNVPDAEKYLINYENAILFENENDLRKGWKDLLEDRGKLNQIQNNAIESAFEMHTFKHRVSQILANF